MADLAYPHIQSFFRPHDFPEADDVSERLATEHELRAVMEADQWARSDRMHLEAQSSSRVHKLCEACWENQPMLEAGLRGVGLASDRLNMPDGTFLIQHDWAGALGAQALEVGNDFRPPFDRSVFEMRVNGRNLITYVAIADGFPLGAMPFVEIDGLWVGFDSRRTEEYPLLYKTWNQIRAACVALDAEVATHDVVRAPAKLNAKREKAGKLRILDHHVINLARRRATAAELPGAGTGNRKRLHFRRGHWRHFEDHKTWIKWMLVGNPDLGFIDKEYRL